MPKDMEHITRAMAVRVLNEPGLPATFDTHRIEKLILKHYAIAFARELLSLNTRRIL
jgi:hypothetical protein